MRTRLAILVALVLPAWTAALADTVSQAPSAVSVTIYHDDDLSTSDLIRSGDPSWVADQGVALITETREVDLPAGPSLIRFRGVASTMVPQSADIGGLPDGTLERDFDYDLLSPGSLLARSIGETVQLVRTDPATGKRIQVAATIRTGPDGVLLEIDGKLEALHCSGLPETLVLDKAPDGLTDVPTLAVRTNAPAAGHYTVRLSYIATGLNWSADYVARIRPGGHALDLTGWLTLANFGATGFVHVPIEAVAGKLNATGDDRPVHPLTTTPAAQCWPTKFNWGTPVPLDLRSRRLGEDYQSSPVAVTALTDADLAAERALGDYKLYTLPEPTDMPARETKQVQFLDQRDVPFERVYFHRIDGEDGSDATDPAITALRLRNVAEAGLGKPLPAGDFALSETGPDGAPVFIGQARIRDTPVGLPFDISGGTTFSVQVKHAVVLETHSGKGDGARTQRTLDFEIANNRPETVVVEMAQTLGDGTVRILSESLAHSTDRGSAIWLVTLKPGERVPLRIGLETPG